MIDEVYNKLNDQVWEIPTSNQYISDSESPLSLISTTMPSPTLTPSNAIALSSVMSSFDDDQGKIKLSYPSRPSTVTSHYSRSYESSVVTTTSTSTSIAFTTSKERSNDNNQEVVAKYGSVTCHEGTIACNDAIACIKPQSVSIKWPGPVTDVEREEQRSQSPSQSYTISNESSQDTEIQTAYSRKSGRYIELEAPINKDKGNQKHMDVVHTFQQGYSSLSSQEDSEEGDTISFDDIINDNGFSGLDGEPNLTETTSKEESDALDTPPTIEISKKRKRKDIAKPKSNASTVATTIFNSHEMSPLPTSGTSKKRRLTAVVRGNNSNNKSTGTKKSPQKKKRTVTSYDAQTSQYLKSVFFEVYSKQSKLNKEQRAAVQEKTGLPSRNITYWFSNHKRRFQNILETYRKAVNDSKGSVKCYEDFIQWLKEHDSPKNTN